jgi:hypothetical protein
MKKTGKQEGIVVALFSCMFLTTWASPGAAREPPIDAVRKIWDQAPHNAFTDLIRFQDRWYCVFREGKGHVSPDGAIRVITSHDGQKWSSAARIKLADWDLRDPKVTLAPDGRLMLIGAAARRPPDKEEHRSLVWYSKDAANWGAPIEIGETNYWIWRATWHKGAAYAVGYGTTTEKSIRLYHSKDGKSFKPLVNRLFSEGYPNESSTLFDHDDSALCLVRRDEKPNSAVLGSAKPPYTSWRWKDLGVPLGGPHMIRLPDGRIVAAGRRHDGSVRTSLHWLDPAAGKLTEFVKLPSGGDTSYPGLAWHDGKLYVSYYSSHEGKTSIYLAVVRL